jgi:hypothetical protein
VVSCAADGGPGCTAAVSPEKPGRRWRPIIEIGLQLARLRVRLALEVESRMSDEKSTPQTNQQRSGDLAERSSQVGQNVTPVNPPKPPPNNPAPGNTPKK